MKYRVARKKGEQGKGLRKDEIMDTNVMEVQAVGKRESMASVLMKLK